MNILITGGAGFIGTNLIKRLLKEGHNVVSLDNYSTGKEENEQKFLAPKTFVILQIIIVIQLINS